MTLPELQAFINECAAAGVKPDTKIMVRVNVKAGIKAIWTKD